MIKHESHELVAALYSGRTWGSHADVASIPPLVDVAHELRTPLQAVLGYLEILREECADGLGEEPRRILDRMNLNAHQLALTVENVMELALGDFVRPHAYEDFSIRRLLAELKPSFDAAIEEKKLALTFHVADVPPKIRSRRRPIRLILQNLVRNAIKSASNGLVIVAVRRCEIDVRGGIEIEVGNGAADAPSIFEMDLGLAVVKRNVEALGGKMAFRPISEGGPSVLVRIPVA